MAEALHDLQMLVPGVSRRLGQVHARVTPEAMADGVQMLAMLPASRDHAVRRAQIRAASVVAVAAFKQQRDWIDFALASPGPDASQEHRCVVLAYAHQFDEATQKRRASVPKGTWEVWRCSLGPQAAQMMLQQGMCTVWASSSNHRETVSTEPWLCMPLLLRQQHADAILDGLIRCMAINVEDRSKLINTLRVVDAFLACWRRPCFCEPQRLVARVVFVLVAIPRCLSTHRAVLEPRRVLGEMRGVLDEACYRRWWCLVQLA